MMAQEFPFREASDPEKKDVTCYKTYVTKKECFWQTKAELKNDANFFSQDFIDLINGMVHEDPSKRLTISEIKNSNWYKGRELSEKDLQGQLKLKLETIRRQKRKN